MMANFQHDVYRTTSSHMKWTWKKNSPKNCYYTHTVKCVKGFQEERVNKRVQMKPEKYSYPSKLESKHMGKDRTRVLIEQMRMNSIMDLISYSSTAVAKKQQAIITKAFDLLICKGSCSNDLFLPTHANIMNRTRQSLTIGCNQFPLLPLCHSKAVKKQSVVWVASSRQQSGTTTGSGRDYRQTTSHISTAPGSENICQQVYHQQAFHCHPAYSHQWANVRLFLLGAFVYCAVVAALLAHSSH